MRVQALESALVRGKGLMERDAGGVLGGGRAWSFYAGVTPGCYIGSLLDVACHVHRRFTAHSPSASSNPVVQLHGPLKAYKRTNVDSFALFGPLCGRFASSVV